LTFLHVSRFSEGLSLVRVEQDSGDSAEGFIDKRGKFVIGPGPPPNYNLPPMLEHAWCYHEFHEGRARFWVGDVSGKGGYIDKTGRVVIPVKYQRISDFHEGLAWVALPRENGIPFGPLPTGFIDIDGRFVIEPTASFVASGFVQGLCAFSVARRDGSKTGFMDRKGTQVIPPSFGRAWDFSDGLSCVRLDSAEGPKYGYVGLDGTMRIPIEFDDACSFSGGDGVRVEG
jgi:hypothetical protein